MIVKQVVAVRGLAFIQRSHDLTSKRYAAQQGSFYSRCITPIAARPQLSLRIPKRRNIQPLFGPCIQPSMRVRNTPSRHHNTRHALRLGR